MMVKIVTGKINSFKTTRMNYLFDSNKTGDGFVSIKNMVDSKVKSYNIKRLITSEERLFIIRDEFNNLNEKIACSIGPYQVLEKTLKHVETEIRYMIKSKVEPIYLDEIGLLELQDLGFSKIFKEMLESGLDLVISIRTELLSKIVDKYNIKNYAVIK